ncbi:putative RNA-dependent RNA polymerase SHL2 [Iris pallida]|uniref:RNA-dependent RNA polymerase n=1 Tax=Iris pallida TaxID=29817 RepID=A0AAX6DTW7_IRIPA|nr:putative RNA-dependent RNA polymerase SHL2 [Iris pallida]
MGSMGSLRSTTTTSNTTPSSTSHHQKDEWVITQISVAGFDPSTTAKELSSFLEFTFGSVWRCRVKTSWTPPESYPDFQFVLPTSSSTSSSPVPAAPHAFVHFGTPSAAARALSSAAKSDLLLNGHPLRVSANDPDSSNRIYRRRTTDPFRFPDLLRFDIGTLVSPSQFFTSWTHPSPVDLLIDPFDGRCRFLFQKDIPFVTKGTRDAVTIRCDLKIEFLLRDVAELRVSTGEFPFVLIFQLGLGCSPFVYYRTADDDIHVSVPFTLLDDDDPWIRTTDFTPSGALGRCCSFRVAMSPRHGAKLQRAMDYMRERRVTPEVPRQSIAVSEEPGYGAVASDLFFSVHFKVGIGFPILFLVTALVHRGIFNEHQLSDDFFGLLRGQSDVLNECALRHIFSYKRPVFDACGRLRLVQNWLLRFPKLVKETVIPADNVEVRRFVITPTRGYCLPPEVELSNRVLRHYKDISNRFLRVTFMDEGMQQLNSTALNHYVAPIVQNVAGNSFMQRTTMFRRVRNIMDNGFYLCGRKYFFLAFSSNQLRGSSAWFFADDGKTTANTIRTWMGEFVNKNVAKCAARMGQCFSSTYATVDVPRNRVDWSLEDVERNGYCFTDGIGKIAPELAKSVAQKLELTDNPPSAYQIRYAGCKGVVAVWPQSGGNKQLSLRPSMNKFKSTHTMLEVNSWTRFQPGFLNRQIVVLLSSLDVPDDVFARMQESMVGKLDQMLVDPDVAYDVLTTSCAEHGNVAAMMLSAGFRPQNEPHLKAMLSCIRLSQLRDLSEKTRIFVQKGRWLLGCLDELGVLEQGQCFIQASNPSLQNCFLRHGSRFSGRIDNKQVIVGTVVFAKNPCLHPGDVRILEAVDVPGLHHLVDCLVFPQKGERPHSNEASGSDLDGDLYFVTWDENLIPPGKKSWIPMAYEPAEVKLHPRRVSHQDIIDFFVKNLSNDNLGKICNAHVVHADKSHYGAMDEDCLELAELAATAVDFPKTGKQTIMPRRLRPQAYPDFMAKDDYQSYRSEKILGRLYRKIKDASDEDTSELLSIYEDIPYDTDLEIQEANDYLAEAWKTKCSYDRLLNALLGQYRVHKEGEVVTGHICSLPKYSSRKQGEIKERLKNAYYALHKQFRRAFEDMGPDGHQLMDDERSMMYERKASAWYQVTYHPSWVEKTMKLKEPEGDQVPARLSFAWIATDYLVRIKVRCRRKENNNGAGKPIDSLANYLSERI